jgi:hypothetical protein
MHTRLWVALLIVAAMSTALCLAAEENKGAESIVIVAGPNGNVNFPHRQHQSRLGDCKICHALFPQKKDAIEQMKAAGELKKKQVMNRLCVKCHRAEKLAGHKHGPTICTGCHVKPGS